MPLLHLVQSEVAASPLGHRLLRATAGIERRRSHRRGHLFSMYPARRRVSIWSGCAPRVCAIMGGDAILEALQDHLGLHAGETTESVDGGPSVTLEHIECNAACDYAPVMMVNWEFFDNQTPSSARDLVDELRAGHPPLPTRGAPLCTFKETSRVLAGLPDPEAAAAQTSAGDATLAGLRIAKEKGMKALRSGCDAKRPETRADATESKDDATDSGPKPVVGRPSPGRWRRTAVTTATVRSTAPSGWIPTMSSRL